MKTDPVKARYLLKTFVVGPLAVNCYLVADPASAEACLIDPGAEPYGIKNYLTRNALKLKYIINTHGHGDHIAANGFFDVPIYIHSLDAPFLQDPEKNLSTQFLFRVTSPKASRLLADGDRVGLGGLSFAVIHTPGHTPGSISLKLEDVLFTGDTLFAGGVGRTDLVYGDNEALFDSIRKKLFVFPDDTAIYPGHGGSSTIGTEKESNPFLI